MNSSGPAPETVSFAAKAAAEAAADLAAWQAAVAAADQRLRGVRLRLRARSPFFSTLLLYARLLPSRYVPLAATDGTDIFYHPLALPALPGEEQTGVLLHEVLHAALRHVPRRGPRDAFVWNVAADVVVNGIVRAAGFALPEGVLFDEALETLAVEEVYAVLAQRLRNPFDPAVSPAGGLSGAALRELQADWAARFPAPFADLLPTRPADAPALAGAALGPAAQEAFWKSALHRAAAVRAFGQGSDPLGRSRDATAALGPSLDWRGLLWRFLVRTPVDFEGFDRRFVGRGLYLETLAGEAVRVAVCVDTSGSVEDGLLGEFLGEVRGILGAYPHVAAQLWYADAHLYGPHDLRAPDPLPPAQGGGGTDFTPFFAHVATLLPAPDLLVYLSDGYGEFPATAPDTEVLWVVAPGGAVDFPFGQVVRLV